jgi:MFS family permease
MTTATIHEAHPITRWNLRQLYWDVFYFGILAGSTLAFQSIYAARLGASGLQIGLLSAGPAIVGLIFTLPSGRWLEGRSFIKVTFQSAILQRVGYIFLVGLPWLFPSAIGQVWGLIYTTLVMSVAGTVLAISFNALFAEVLPADVRAYAVGRRNVLLAVSITAATLISGQILDFVVFPRNYQIVFLIGAFGAMMSSFHLGRIRTPLPSGPAASLADPPSEPNPKSGAQASPGSNTTSDTPSEPLSDPATIPNPKIAARALPAPAARTSLQAARTSLQAARTSLQAARTSLQAARAFLKAARAFLKAARAFLKAARTSLQAAPAPLQDTTSDPLASESSALARPRAFVRLDLLTGPFGIFMVAYLVFYAFQYFPIPIFPIAYVDSLHMTDGMIGIGTAIFYGAMMLASFRLSHISARYGHRRILAVSAAIFPTFPLLLGVARGPELYYLACLIGGGVNAMLTGALINRLMEKVPSNDRPAHMALHNLALNLGILAGSLLGPVAADLMGTQPSLLVRAGLRLVAAGFFFLWG